MIIGLEGAYRGKMNERLLLVLCKVVVIVWPGKRGKVETKYAWMHRRPRIAIDPGLIPLLSQGIRQTLDKHQPRRSVPCSFAAS